VRRSGWWHLLWLSPDRASLLCRRSRDYRSGRRWLGGSHLVSQFFLYFCDAFNEVNIHQHLFDPCLSFPEDYRFAFWSLAVILRQPYVRRQPCCRSRRREVSQYGPWSRIQRCIRQGIESQALEGSMARHATGHADCDCTHAYLHGFASRNTPHHLVHYVVSATATIAKEIRGRARPAAGACTRSAKERLYSTTTLRSRGRLSARDHRTRCALPADR